MRRWPVAAAALLALWMWASPSNVRAELPPPGSARHLTPRQLKSVASGVERTHDAFEAQRHRDGWGNVLGGTIVSGLGGYFMYEGLQVYDDAFVSLLGAGIVLRGVGTLVEGVFNIASPTSQEEISERLLDDPGLMETSGLLFLEQEARRARRARILGGTTQIVGGLASGISLIPVTQLVGQQEILTVVYLVFGAFAVLQVIGGLVDLAGKSAAEKIYLETLDAIGGAQPARPSETPREISHLILVPTLFAPAAGGRFASRTGARSPVGGGLRLGFAF